jgi:hypothetical protein
VRQDGDDAEVRLGAGRVYRPDPSPGNRGVNEDSVGDVGDLVLG